MRDIAYVNGEFSDLAEARVSVEDRGFQFADGVYEVIVAPGGRPFRLEQHLGRLKRSTDGIDLAVDYASLDLPGVIAEGIRRCGFKDVMVYIQITRGVAPRGHEFPRDVTPTVVATFKARPVYDPELRRRGVSLKTFPDIRWARCSIKSIALLPNVLVKHETGREGYYDAIFVDSEGMVRETTRTNIFIVTGGTLRTPPLSEHILHGVTRNYVLECARASGVACAEEDFSAATLLAADEAFISSTTADIIPVTRVDDQPIGNGQPGPITQRLYACFAGARAD